MKLLLLGPPGVGKGTQAAFITQRYGIRHISTGDMLRAAVSEGSALGQLAKTHMDRGGLVPDELIIDLVRERIAHADCRSGFLLDGFPRTIPQAQAMAVAGIHVDFIVEFWLEEEQLLRRASGRLVHLASGRTYHVLFNPPRVAGRDDVTGEPLVQRADDHIDTARKRLDVHARHAGALSAYYRGLAGSGGENAPRYVRISASGNPQEVRDAVFAVLDSRVLAVLDSRLLAMPVGAAGARP